MGYIIIYPHLPSLFVFVLPLLPFLPLSPSLSLLTHLSLSSPSYLFSPSREKARLATDSELDQDLSERLGLGSSDTLTNGNRADGEAAKRLAKRLFTLDGFRKSDVARHLSKK